MLFQSVLFLGSSLAMTQSEEIPNKQAANYQRPIVAIGDLHGDWKNTIIALIEADLIQAIDSDIPQKKIFTENETIKVKNEENRFGFVWDGGDTILVQTGDIADRGPHALRIYQFLQILKEQARRDGGDVIMLLGKAKINIRKS